MKFSLNVWFKKTESYVFAQKITPIKSFLYPTTLNNHQYDKTGYMCKKCHKKISKLEILEDISQLRHFLLKMKMGGLLIEVLTVFIRHGYLYHILWFVARSYSKSIFSVFCSNKTCHRPVLYLSSVYYRAHCQTEVIRKFIPKNVSYR